MDYLTLKTIHVISSTILFGTGIGSAFYMFMANRRKNIAEMRFAVKFVVIADYIFTTPSVIVQLITGLWMMQVGGLDFSQKWLLWGLFLYFFAGICWLPVVYIQIRMEKLLLAAQKEALSPNYWKLDFWWIALGSLAFPAIIVVFWLMVNKPV